MKNDVIIKHMLIILYEEKYTYIFLYQIKNYSIKFSRIKESINHELNSNRSRESTQTLTHTPYIDIYMYRIWWKTLQPKYKIGFIDVDNLG